MTENVERISYWKGYNEFVVYLLGKERSLGQIYWKPDLFSVSNSVAHLVNVP